MPKKEYKQNEYLGTKFKREAREPLKFENCILKPKDSAPTGNTNHNFTESLVNLNQISALIGTNRK